MLYVDLYRNDVFGWIKVYNFPKEDAHIRNITVI